MSHGQTGNNRTLEIGVAYCRLVTKSMVLECHTDKQEITEHLKLEWSASDWLLVLRALKRWVKQEITEHLRVYWLTASLNLL